MATCVRERCVSSRDGVSPQCPDLCVPGTGGLERVCLRHSTSTIFTCVPATRVSPLLRPLLRGAELVCPRYCSSAVNLGSLRNGRGDPADLDEENSLVFVDLLQTEGSCWCVPATPAISGVSPRFLRFLRKGCVPTISVTGFCDWSRCGNTSGERGLLYGRGGAGSDLPVQGTQL